VDLPEPRRFDRLGACNNACRYAVQLRPPALPQWHRRLNGPPILLAERKAKPKSNTQVDQLEKRRREQTRKQKQQDKQQRRAKRENEKRINPDGTIDKDADLKDMVPGPQPGQILDFD